jgi:hypothetical protein
MLQATVEFTAVDEDGSQIQVRKGVLQVHEDDHLAKQYPHRFRRVVGGRDGARSDVVRLGGSVAVRDSRAPAKRASSRSAGHLRRDDVPQCRLSERQSFTRVRFTSEARRQVLAVIADATKGRETGGLLFGQASAGGLIEVLRCSGPGPDAQCDVDRYDADLSHDMSLIEEFGDCVGRFHTHPGGTRSPSGPKHAFTPKQVAIRLTAEQVARIDRLRDLAPREPFVRRLVDEALATREKAKR